MNATRCAASNRQMRSLLLAAVLLAACGPSTRPASYAGGERYLSSGFKYEDPGSAVVFTPTRKVGYKLSRRCAQGPLVLTLPALGDPVGEYVYVQMNGPQHVVGHYEVVVAGQKGKVYGTFATPDAEGKAVTAPQNDKCLAPEQKGTVATTPGAPGTPTTTTTTGGPPPSGGGEIVVFEETPLPPSPSGYGIRIVYRVEGKVSAGTEIKITFWSEQPNDWDGYVTWVEQGKLVPEDMGKWSAGAQAKAKETEIDKAKRERETACINGYWAKKKMTPECEAEFPGLPEKKQKEADCWQVWNKQKLWTDECRVATGMDPTKWTSDEGKPSSAPPPAPADPQPPKPSIHAEWIPGNYHWSISGKIWVWSPGVWSVPSSDVESGQTAKAPGAPPAAKPESPPPQPFPGAVWTPGWWAFQVSGWIWIDGAWRMPPFAGAIWKPYVWVSAGFGFTLSPGGWAKP